MYSLLIDKPGGSVSKRIACNEEMQVRSWVGMIPWRRKWQCTPVFLPGESHGHRSLVGYSPVHGIAKNRTRLKQLSTHARKKSHTQKRQKASSMDRFAELPQALSVFECMSVSHHRGCGGRGRYASCEEGTPQDYHRGGKVATCQPQIQSTRHTWGHGLSQEETEGIILTF